MTSPVVSNEMNVILGATGNTGSIVAKFLLSKGKKVRVVGRDSGRLEPFVAKGAEAFTATVSDPGRPYNFGSDPPPNLEADSSYNGSSLQAGT